VPQFETDDGVTVRYADVGSGDRPPIVLCHGLALSGEQMSADAAYFVGLGHRVLVPDLRGHGGSGRPQRMTSASFSIERIAKDQLAMLDHARVGKAHWVGNSLGGIVGLELLGSAAGRLLSLATFGTIYALWLPRWGAHAIPLARAILGPKAYAFAAGWAMARKPAGQKLVARIVEDVDPQVVRLTAHNLARFNLIGNALSSDLPILMLRGGRDLQMNVLLPPTLWAMRRRANFKLIDIPGGHCPNLDAVDRVRNELLRFWAQPTAGDGRSTHRNRPH